MLGLYKFLGRQFVNVWVWSYQCTSFMMGSLMFICQNLTSGNWTLEEDNLRNVFISCQTFRVFLSRYWHMFVLIFQFRYCKFVSGLMSLLSCKPLKNSIWLLKSIFVSFIAILLVKFLCVMFVNVSALSLSKLTCHHACKFYASFISWSELQSEHFT